MARADFVAFVLDQLSDLPDVTSRAMFGGHGLYLHDAFFGIIFNDRLYLKTDESTRAWYEERGMPFFQPNARQRSKKFLEVPADTIKDRDQLTTRAAEAVSVATK